MADQGLFIRHEKTNYIHFIIEHGKQSSKITLSCFNIHRKMKNKIQKRWGNMFTNNPIFYQLSKKGEGRTETGQNQSTYLIKFEKGKRMKKQKMIKPMYIEPNKDIDIKNPPTQKSSQRGAINL